MQLVDADVHLANFMVSVGCISEEKEGDLTEEKLLEEREVNGMNGVCEWRSPSIGRLKSEI